MGRIRAPRWDAMQPHLVPALAYNSIVRPIVSMGVLLHTIQAPGRRIWIKDLSGRFIYACPHLTLDAGGHIIGMSDGDLPWADRAIDYAVSDSEAAERPVVVWDEKVRSAAGHVLAVVTRKVPLLDARGELLGTLGSFDVVPQGAPAAAAERDCRSCIDELTAYLRAHLDDV